MEKIVRDGETAGENNHRCVLGSAVLASMQVGMFAQLAALSACSQRSLPSSSPSSSGVEKYLKFMKDRHTIPIQRLRSFPDSFDHVVRRK